ncbi:MAG: hypothetical protein Q8916_02475 [Bacteroidota bacterium]|nr:hypothetical protein [Bacteroidota bacterium]
MKQYLTSLFAIGILAITGQSFAQQSLFGIRLQDANSHVLSINAPTTGFTASYNFRFPAGMPAAGALLYASDGAGQSAWLPAGTAGQVLSFAAGLPVWTDINTLISATTGWAVTGNATLSAYNGITGSYLGTSTAQPLVVATTNILSPQPIEFYTNNSEKMRLSSGGELGIGLSPTAGKLLHVAGTAGTSNIRLASLASATGTTGRIMFATDGTGDLQTLAFPSSSGMVLSSTTSGTLSWVSEASGSGWTTTGNSGTSPSTNFIGTTDAQDLVVKTGGSASTNERLRVTSAGKIGIGNIIPSATLDLKGDYATRYAGSTLSNGVNNDVDPSSSSYLRISGPTAAYSITGFAGGSDGKRLTIFNATGQVLTLSYDNSSATSGNRLFIPTRSDLTVYDSGTVSLVYDAVNAHWSVTNFTNALLPQVGAQILARKPSNENRTTNTTMTNDADLQWSVGANQVWEVRGMLIVSSGSSTPDFKFQFVGPGGTGDGLTLDHKAYSISSTGGGFSEINLMTAYSSSSGDITVKNNAKTVVEVAGVFTIGSAGGSVKLQWAQQNSNATATTLEKDTYLFITRIQ